MFGLYVQPHVDLLGYLSLGICLALCYGLNSSVDCPSESWEIPVPLDNFGHSKSDCRSSASCRDQPCLAGETCECTPKCGLRCETICPTVEPTFNMVGRKAGPCGQPKCQPGMKCIHRYKECLCVAGCGHRCLVRSEPARAQIAKKEPCDLTGRGKTLLWSGLELENMCRGFNSCNTSADCSETQYCKCNQICGLVCLTRPARNHQSTTRSTVLTTAPEPCELPGRGKTFLWSGLELENMCRGFNSCNTSADCSETQYCKCNQICGLVCLTRPVRKQQQSTTQSTVTVITTAPDAGVTTFTTAGNTVQSTGEAENPHSPRWSVCNLYKHRRVCGSDGNTYRTLCDFRDKRKGDVYIQHWGSCHHAKATLSAVHDGMRFGCNTLQRGDQLNFTESTDFQQVCTNSTILFHHSAETELGVDLCDDPRPCETNSDCTGKDEICICVILTPHVQAAAEEQEYTQPPEKSTSGDIQATNPHLNLSSTPTTGSPQTTA